MRVAERYHPLPLTAEADESLADAAGRMQWHAIGALPVYDRHELVGIISERDLTASIADGADPATTPISEYMTAAPATAGPDENLLEAAHRMAELGIRHLPVMDGHRLIGMLSIRDLLEADLLEADRLVGAGLKGRPR